MKIPNHLQIGITFSSEYCQEHEYYGKVKPVQKIMMDGQAVCPKCGLEPLNQQIQQEMQKNYDQSEYNMTDEQKRKLLFHRKSVISDPTILNASFDNYKVDIPEEKENKRLCLEAVERYKAGQVFNIFLAGVQGAGKSHLAFAILRALDELETASCLFVNVEEMLRLIKDSFNNKDSRYTEQYFVDLLSSVDYLVLDDLGAETGAIDTEKRATDFVQRILYAVTTTRQDKSTISTTNLNSKTLFNMYDKKVMSRLLRNPKYILFEKTPDKRMSNIPF